MFRDILLWCFNHPMATILISSALMIIGILFCVINVLIGFIIIASSISVFIIGAIAVCSCSIKELGEE